jgi:hypothetical protein
VDDRRSEGATKPMKDASSCSFDQRGRVARTKTLKTRPVTVKGPEGCSEGQRAARTCDWMETARSCGIRGFIPNLERYVNAMRAGVRRRRRKARARDELLSNLNPLKGTFPSGARMSTRDGRLRPPVCDIRATGE